MKNLCRALLRGRLGLALLPTLLPALLVVGSDLCVSESAASTIVRYHTSLGEFDLRLYDTAAPSSVENFLNYVRDGDYTESLFHDSQPGALYGGAFRYPTNLEPVPSDPPILNEFGISNRRGTLAYDKFGSNPDSATSHWFFNLVDNTADSTADGATDFDTLHGGYTVLGRVLSDGMSVIDQIAALEKVPVFLGGFHQLPVLESFSSDDGVLQEDFVFVHSIEEIPHLTGDYNFDGIVDAADYTVWRDNRGSTVEAAADGNGDGIVDLADYLLWRESLGPDLADLPGSLLPVPEPASGLLLLVVAAVVLAAGRLLKAVSKQV